MRRVKSRYSAKRREAEASAREAELDPEVQYWKDEIEDYERMTDKWFRRVRKIEKRYKDIRSPREEAVTRFNVFWANTQIRMPALYARNPKARVERRFRDRDPIGRVTSEVLERAIQYHLDSVNDTMLINRQALLDYELSGRGTTWIRYVPHFRHRPAEERSEPRDDGTPPVDNPDSATGPQLGGSTAVPSEQLAHDSEDELAAEGVQTTTAADSEYLEDELTHEECKLDYVQWGDFGHTWRRTWDEVRGVWRKVYLDRSELRERFVGNDMLTEEQLRQIPLDYSPKTLQDARVPVTRKKAIVYEIWDRHAGEILFYCRGCPWFLDRRADPEKLKDFYPCPRPLYANLANDDLVPVPNFVHYQDQANEIDELSSRITSITKCLKVAGVRDTSAEGLDRLLAEGVENQLVPVEGWAIHKEKGGLKGVYELLPMQEIAETLGYMREQRKELIDDVYQLTGISDIVRGLSDPSETATAQQLKGHFSILRIQDAQQDVQRFCRDQVHIMGEMIARFSIETLKAISGVKLLTAAEKQQLQAQIQVQQRLAALQAAAQPPPAPGPAPAPGGLSQGGGLPQPHLGGPPGAAGVAPQPGAAMTHPMAPGPAQGGPPAPGAMPGAASPPAPMGGGMNPSAPATPGTPAPGQAPVSPEKLQLLELPTWEDVEALLANPVVREFRLDIETDSTIRMDEEAEKQSRMELLKAVGEYMTQAMTAGATAPEIVPMLAELLMFGIRAFNTARSVEQTFEDMMAALEQAAKQPRPNPEVMKAQIQAQSDQVIAQGKAQIELHADQARMQLEAQFKQAQENAVAQREAHQTQLDMQLDQWKAALKAHLDQALQDSKHHFEAERVQFEAAAKERLVLLEHGLNARLEARRQAHERSMGAADRNSQERIGRSRGRNGQQKAA